MKVVLRRDVAIDGRHHSAGETVEVSDSDGIALVNMVLVGKKGMVPIYKLIMIMGDMIRIMVKHLLK